MDHQVLSDEPISVREALWKAVVCRIEKQARSFDRIACNNHVPRTLKAPLALPREGETGGSAVPTHLDPADHRQITNFDARRDRPRDPGDQHTLLCVRRTADATEAAIDAGMGEAARRRERGKRSRRPVDTQRFGASGE